ncbi:MAG: aldehyde dehydrogenase family protein [Acidobacteriota bacterium]
MSRQYDRIFLDGQWVAPHASDTLEVLNPASEIPIGSIPLADEEDARRAVDSAAAALPGWAATPLEERLEALKALRNALLKERQDLARLIAAEVGTPLPLSLQVQVGLPLRVIGDTVQTAESFPWEETVRNSLVLHQPAGVAALITPWNFPLHQMIAKVAPAVAAGCTVVLKPSEVTPLVAYRLAEAVERAGWPPGVFNLLPGTGPSAGEALVRDPRVSVISFTGSTAAGRRVATVAAEGIKRVALELGGKSPSLVLDDADLAAAVRHAARSSFYNSGQTCSALTRLLVPRRSLAEAEAIAAEVADGTTVGDPLGEKPPAMGPVVSAAQRDRVRGYIQSGLDSGARLLCGGGEAPEGLERGFYVRPTVFSEVKPEMAIAREEIFGPVLSILPYETQEEGIALANASEYGLAAAVWSADAERAHRVARQLHSGQVDINGGRYNSLAPFGGFKHSGLGREFGAHGLREYLEVQALQR